MKKYKDMILMTICPICLLLSLPGLARAAGVVQIGTGGGPVEFISSFPVMVVSLIIGMFLFLCWVARLTVNYILSDFRDGMIELGQKFDGLSDKLSATATDLYQLDRERASSIAKIDKEQASIKATCTAHRHSCPGQRRRQVREDI